MSRPITDDLEEGGRTELNFGVDDGNPYPLCERDDRPGLIWSVKLGHRIGESSVAVDVGEGQAEILVGAKEERRYCLRR